MVLGTTTMRLGHFLAAIWGILQAGSCGAETLRIATWNLGFETNSEKVAAVVEQAAGELKSVDPDVILLQGVTDWRLCAQLTEALKPLDYNVLICSAFRRESLLSPVRPQVAVLSKQKAYFSWSEAGGAVFVAIQEGSQRLGFFSACDDYSSREKMTRRLLEEIDSIRQWETNQVQTFVIGATFELSPQKVSKAVRQASLDFEHAGLADAAEKLPAEARATRRLQGGRTEPVADVLFAGPLGFPTNARIINSPVCNHYLLTCDLELDSDKVAIALDLRAEERREKEAEESAAMRRMAYVAVTASIAGLAVAVGIWTKRRRATRAASPVSNRLPVSVPSKAASPLRPVVFARAPSRTDRLRPPSLPQTSRPVLRLKKPSRMPHQQESESFPIESKPALVEPVRTAEARERATQEETVLTRERPAPGMNDIRDPALRQGLIKELSGWLKQKFVRKLVSDRSQLIEAQQIATRMANTLDDRLARIEAQIRQQNQAYVSRIEELNKELAAAREENRELIRERIAQVKAEMEAARARVLAEANLDSTSFRL